MSVKNQFGFSLIESMMGLFILTVSAGAMLSMAKLQFGSQRENMDYAAIVSLRESILATVGSQESWNRTKALNSTMACSRKYPSTCAENEIHEINIYRSDGNLFVGSMNPTQGFTADGKPCSNYGVPSSPCQIKARVFWKNVCVSASPPGCKYPMDQVTVLFFSKSENLKKYTDANGRLRQFDVLSMNRHSFGINNSPVASCLAKGSFVFVGFGKSFATPRGAVATADSDGCVNIGAFKGARGDPGPMGPMGPMGMMGAQGPQGAPGSIFTVAGGGPPSPPCVEPGCPPPSPPSPPPCTAFGCPPPPPPQPPAIPPGKWICPGNDQNNPSEWLPYPEDMRLFPSLYSQICGGGLGGGDGSGGAGGAGS